MAEKILMLAFLVLSSTFAPLCANDFGFLKESGKKENSDYSPYIIHKIAKGQILTYCVDGNAPQDKLDSLEQTAVRALNNWFASTVKQIEFLDRKAEFEDLYPIIAQEVKLQKVNCSASLKHYSFLASNKPGYQYNDQIEDMRLMLLNDKTFERHMDRRAGGVMMEGTENAKPGFIAIRESKAEDKSDFYSVIVHEIGHLLGLSDQYLSGRINTDPQYGTSATRNAVMGYSKYLTCDDNDGLINLIDCKVNNKQRGGAKGWRSLCPDNIVFNNCSEVGRAPFVTFRETVESAQVNITQYNEDGSVKISKTEFSRGARLDYSPLDVLLSGKIKNIQRDKDNRIIAFEDEGGVKTRLNHFPDSLTELISVNTKNEDMRPFVANMQYKPNADKSISFEYSDNNNAITKITLRPQDKTSYNASIHKGGKNSRAMIYKQTPQHTLITACLGKNSTYCERGNPQSVYYYEDGKNSAACLVNQRSAAYCVNGDGSADLDKDSKAYAAIADAVAQTKLQLGQLLQTQQDKAEANQKILSEYLQDIAQLRTYAKLAFNIFDGAQVKNAEIKTELQKLLKEPKHISGKQLY